MIREISKNDGYHKASPKQRKSICLQEKASSVRWARHTNKESKGSPFVHPPIGLRFASHGGGAEGDG